MSSVVSYVSGQLGNKVGDGECVRLVETALQRAGMKTTTDYGVVGKTADYKWGRLVTLDEARPGDVVQFRNHSQVFTTRNRMTGKESVTTVERPHHTAVITSVGVRGGGDSFPRTPMYFLFSILEQNQGGKKWVVKNKVQFERSVVELSKEVELITESHGEFWIYRPERK